MKKRGKTLLLVLLSLIAAGTVSCAENETLPAADTADETAAPVTEAVTEEARIPSSLPETDLNGFVFTMFQAETFFHEKEIYAEAENGDIVNDAVFRRNRGIMEKYNCVLEEQMTDDYYCMDKLTPAILAGDDTVDLIFECGDRATVNAPYFLDFTDLPYLDFTKPWWNEEFNQSVMLNGHLYFTMGAHMISAKSSLIGVVVNKDTAKNYDIDVQELYSAARDGVWTLDQLGSLAKLASVDINGDGVMDEKDQWGILGENYMNWSLALGSGFQCVTHDADGSFVYSFGCEKNTAIMDKVMRYTTDKNLTLFAQQMQTSDHYQTLREMTANGQYLFDLTWLVNDMRAFTYDYGFLPIPKYDEQQKRYYSDGSLGNNRLMVIPKTTSDPDTAAFLIEAIAYASYYELLPVYYQDFLNTKVLRDEESVEMLRIIQDALYYDCGALYNWGEMRWTIEGLAAASSNTLASTAAAKEKEVLSAIEATLAALDESST